MKATDWVTLGIAAVAAIATVAAAIAAAVSARASSETARIVKAEHDAEIARRELEPMFELQGLLRDFLELVTERTEGSSTANQLHRRISVFVEQSGLREGRLPETIRLAESEVATVEQARKALQEVSAQLPQPWR